MDVLVDDCGRVDAELNKVLVESSAEDAIAHRIRDEVVDEPNERNS